MSPVSPTNKPSVQERVLASIDLIDASEACALLRIEAVDPGSAMEALVRDDAVIALTHDGKTMFPRFQFDAELDRVFDVVGALLKLKPARISNLRLSYWLTCVHVDFGCPRRNSLAMMMQKLSPHSGAISSRFGMGDLCRNEAACLSWDRHMK